MAKKRFSNFKELIDFYNINFAPLLNSEVQVCKNVADSNYFTDDEKAETILMWAHQWRLNHHPIERDIIIRKLAFDKPWLKSYKDFEEVYEYINNEYRPLKWVGDLNIYDLAKRIGYIVGIEPVKNVYACTGAQKGGERLLGRNIGKKTPKIDFDPYFPTLSAMHIENILCIMKDFFIPGGIDISQEKNFRECKLKMYCNESLEEKVKKHIPQYF